MTMDLGTEAAEAVGNCEQSYRNQEGHTPELGCSVTSSTWLRHGPCALGVDTDPLVSTDSRERVDAVTSIRTLEAMAFGDITPGSSSVVVHQGSSTQTLTPSGWVSIRRGYCPSGTCPLTIEGLLVQVPNFTLNGTALTNVELSGLGNWDGQVYSDGTYALFGSTVIQGLASAGGVPSVQVGRSGEDEINGVIQMTGSRYATLSGVFTIPSAPGGPITLTLNLTAPLSSGGPTVAVTSIVQPPCGVEPCGGITYDATSARTFAGTTNVTFRWVDQLDRVVGTAPKLDSDAVTNVSGSPSPWPVRLIVRDETTGLNQVPRTQLLAGPGTPSRAGEFYIQDDFGRALSRGFLNRDSYEDIVVGTPNDANRTGASAFGAVNVVFGGRPDARYGRDFRWTLPSGTAADDFGSVVAVGDFNGDGREDVVASAPGRFSAGAVYIAYQTASQLSTVPPSGALAELKATDAPGWIAGGTGFGRALATGDFNNDGADDLAVGTPSYNSARGAVWIYYGKPGVGIVTGAGAVRAPHRVQLFDYETTLTAPNMAYGSALTAEDFDGDGRDDLAIGVPRTATSASNTYVSVLYGTSTGITTTKRYLFTGLGRCGTSLAAGNFTNDSYYDLALGCPENNLTGTAAGAVYVLRGASGLLGSSELYRQSASDPGGAGCRTGAANDRFGTTLTIGRIGSDRRDDLVVLGDATTTARDMVFALRGDTATVGGRVFPIAAEQCFARSVFITSGSASLGAALTTADITHDGLQDIVIGSFTDAGGRVDVLPAVYGTGLSTSAVYNFRQPTIF